MDDFGTNAPAEGNIGLSVYTIGLYLLNFQRLIIY